MYPGPQVSKTGTICVWSIARRLWCVANSVPGCIRVLHYSSKTDRIYPFRAYCLHPFLVILDFGVALGVFFPPRTSRHELVLRRKNERSPKPRACVHVFSLSDVAYHRRRHISAMVLAPHRKRRASSTHKNTYILCRCSTCAGPSYRGGRGDVAVMRSRSEGLL